MVASGERLIASLGPTQLEHGGELPTTEVAFQTWGRQSSDNVVWVCHAISGDSNAAAWWSRLIGPGRAIDTDQYLVVCSNVIGGCQGSTGPLSPAPDGKPYGARFPRVTLGDMVAVQQRLADHLGIDQIALVCGGSMGGMQALEWARQAGSRVQRAWLTASAHAHNPMQIGFNEVARQAIIRDPLWHGGNYAPSAEPNNGLAVGRMLGHLSYLSEPAFRAKFGRRLQSEAERKQQADFLRPEIFEVESYLNYQGDKFTQRFDANTFLIVSQAIDEYECTDFASIRARLLLTSFTTDWLYPPYQSELVQNIAQQAGVRAEWLNIASALGHDAFLLDDQVQAEAVREFLSR